MKINALLLLVGILTSTVVFAQDGYEVGDKAMNFTLQNVDGRMVSLSDYDDQKGAFVIFTCNHCPYSIAYEDRIIALHQKYAPQGYPVIAINPNDPKLQPEDSFELMKTRALDKDFPFPYLLDKGQKVYPEYGANRTPHVFLLMNRGNYFEVAYIGAIDDNYQNADEVTQHFVEDALTDLQNGKNPRTNFTKAIGCTIKDAYRK
jgi:peroxiredoxin